MLVIVFRWISLSFHPSLETHIASLYPSFSRIKWEEPSRMANKSHRGRKTQASGQRDVTVHRSLLCVVSMSSQGFSTEPQFLSSSAPVGLFRSFLLFNSHLWVWFPGVVEISSWWLPIEDWQVSSPKAFNELFTVDHYLSLLELRFH